MVSASVPIRMRADLPFRRMRWLVIAPHPDDETLGCGALIAQMARERRFAGLVYLTDGSGSHPAEAQRTTRRLIRLRQREGALALRRLAGLDVAPPLHLAWRDAHPADATGSTFRRSCRKLASICRRRAVDAIAVTALHEPHCDHAAAAVLAYAVQATAGRALAIFEYPVWSDHSGFARHISFCTAPLATGLRRRALFSHRSQLTASFGPGFRLPKAALRMPERDRLFQRRRNHAAA